MTRDDERGRRFPPAVPALLLLPPLLLALSLSYLLDWRPRRGARPRPPEVADVHVVRGWTGVLEGPGGARLAVELGPLHSAPGRQGFEALTLARRLALPAGQPWRLTLRHADPAPAAPSIDLSGVELVDAHGARLAPIDAHAPSGAAVVDPLLVLLSAPLPELAPGSATRLVLWGDEPRGAVRLRGLAAVDGDGALPFAGELTLEERELAVSEADEALARIEAVPERWGVEEGR